MAGWWKAALGIGTGAAGGWLLPAVGLGLGTFGQIYGARKQGTANRDALAAEQRANTEAMQIAMADREESKRQFDLQMQAQQSALAAQNKFEGDRWAASEEERLYDRRLKDEREARRAPYRAASASALAEMPGLLASHRGSFGSFRR